MKRALAIALLALACGKAPEPEWLRVTKLSVPESPREAGCSTVGRNAGGGLTDLVILTGGLQQYVQETSETTIVRVVLLAAATKEREGWSLDFEGGRQARHEEFRVIDDAEGDGVFASVEPDADGWFAAAGGGFNLPVPVLGELMLKSHMEGTHLEGRLTEGGLSGAPLLLTGYYSEAELRAMVAQVLDACAAGKAPNICGIIERETNGMPELALESVVTLMGGADTALVDGKPQVCGGDTGQACNAVSVCLALELGATQVVP